MADRAPIWTGRGVDERLVGTRFGPVRWFERLDSTNRYLLDEATAGAPAGTVVVADEQVAGRGRRDRRWDARSGGALLVSVLTRPAELPPMRGTWPRRPRRWPCRTPWSSPPGSGRC
ncbi:MAG: hypothetical protein M5U31_08665 [Acidimicrobiia bacterium]|nr:hypothetical protein [Acidimicrobiia bacterium]